MKGTSTTKSSKGHKLYPSLSALPPPPRTRRREVPHRRIRPENSSSSGSRYNSDESPASIRNINSFQERDVHIHTRPDQVPFDETEAPALVATDSLSVLTQTPASNVAESLMKRFPREHDREKLFKILKVQQEIWKQVEERGVDYFKNSPAPIKDQEAVDCSTPTEKENLASMVETQTRIWKELRDDRDTTQTKTVPRRFQATVQNHNSKLENLAELIGSLNDVCQKLLDTDNLILSLQRARKNALAEAGATNAQLLQALSESKATFDDLCRELTCNDFPASNTPTRKSQDAPEMPTLAFNTSLERSRQEMIRQEAVDHRTCQCCYDEIDSASDSGAHTCSTGEHRFCSTCIRRYMEAWVYGESYPLRTVDFEDEKDDSFFQALPCLSTRCPEGHIPHATMGNVVGDDKVWEAYQEKIFCLRSIQECQSVTRDTIDHEVASLSHNAEETMTEIKVRRCPDCQTPFLKEAGFCNKLRCPSCKIALCYVCRKKVPPRGYDHFCVHNYDSCKQGCGKCPLWTTRDDETDQERMEAVKEARGGRIQTDSRGQRKSSGSSTNPSGEELGTGGECNASSNTSERGRWKRKARRYRRSN